MKNFIFFLAACVCFTTLSYSFNNETLNRPPDCGITDQTFECVFEGELELIVNDINTTNIEILETCLDTCDGTPFVSVTSDFNINNYIYFCSNEGTIPITYTMIDACANTETITVTYNFIDTTPPDLSNCSVNDETIECNGTDNESIANNWNAANVAALQTCVTDSCDIDATFALTSDYDFTNLITTCGAGGSISVTYTVADGCGNETNLTVTLTFVDSTPPDVSSCNIIDTTFNIPCTDLNILTLIDDWHQANLNELVSCSIDDCDIGFNSSTINTSSICIDNSLTVDYFVIDACGNQTMITATAYFDGYSESYIAGNIILDLNADGCNVATDPIFPNLRFNIDGDSRIYYSNDTGSYTLGLQDGAHIITTQVANPDYFTVTPSSVTVDFPTDTSPFNQDFCVTPNGTRNDLEIYLWSTNAVPGFESYLQIYYKNVGNTLLSGDIVFNYNDDVMDLLNANPTEATSTIGNLTWNFANLEPFEARSIGLTMQLNTPTDPTFPLNADDVLSYETIINPITGDETPANNAKNHNLTVSNSFDPNDVTCLEGKEIQLSEVGKYVHYRIRFENNGTANATHVRVRDLIDLAKFDISTLIPIVGSHSFVTDIKNDNEVDFIFDNINLPFDDANNDGYVVFKIKTVASLIVGDTFSNQAAIYFDFNPAVNTNIETTTIIENNLSVDDFENNNQISLYPNPVENQLFIETRSQIKQVTIYNVAGKIIKSIDVKPLAFQNKIDVSNIASGLYFVKVISGNRTRTEKIIKK